LENYQIAVGWVENRSEEIQIDGPRGRVSNGQIAHLKVHLAEGN
jgi:hypothetical protein